MAVRDVSTIDRSCDNCHCRFRVQPRSTRSWTNTIRQVLGVRELEGVTELCLAPFLAVREGLPIHMPNRDAVRDHFAAMIDTYRGGGVATWIRVEASTRELGEHSVFTTVRWNALDAAGNVLRDTDDLPPPRDSPRLADALVHKSLLVPLRLRRHDGRTRARPNKMGRSGPLLACHPRATVCTETPLPARRPTVSSQIRVARRAQKAHMGSEPSLLIATFRDLVPAPVPARSGHARQLPIPPNGAHAHTSSV